MITATLRSNFVCAAGASLLAATLATASRTRKAARSSIGLLVPLTGPLATPGIDMVDGFKLFWEQVEPSGRRTQGRDT